MTILRSLDADIWTAEGPIVSFYTFAYPTRMVVVRLADGGLWLWSPIALTDDLVAETTALGDVRHLVSPNPLHHLYLSQWKAAFPRAGIWGPRSTIDKRRDLHFDGALTDDAPPDWVGQIDQVLFGGSLMMEEVVFFHRASRTAILADLSENLSEDFLARHWSAWRRRLARLWRITEPWGWAPLEWRLSFTDRRRARRAAERIIAWDAEKVVVAHGPLQTENGRAYLERALSWIV